LLEFPVVLPDESDTVEERFGPLFALQAFTVELCKLRLLIERIEMAQSAAKTDMNYTFRFARVMWSAGGLSGHTAGASRPRLHEQRSQRG